ncbi:ATP-dependent helicase, partial [Streptomyces sp. NPDC088178]
MTTAQQQSDASAARLLSCAAVFLPASLPRDGRVAFWDPDGGPLPEPGDFSGYAADPEGSVVAREITVVRGHGRENGIRRCAVPAVLMAVTDALPLLVRARHQRSAHPATRCWGAAALQALNLVARGRLLPGLTGEDHDAWRAGPRDAQDIAHLRAIAAALPAEGYAVPLPDRTPLQVPEPEWLIGAFLDAVADTLPRTPAAAYAMGAPFAARAAQHLPQARDWAVEVAAGLDAGVRISLRLDLSAYELFDTADTYDSPDESDDTDSETDAGQTVADARRGAARHAAAAVTQVHSLADPTHVVDAAALWNGGAGEPFGPRARIDAVLALRRAARVWAPLERLLDQPVPDVLA